MHTITHPNFDSMTMNQTPTLSTLLGPPRPLRECELHLVTLLLAQSRVTTRRRPQSLRAYELDYMGSLLFEREHLGRAVLEEPTFSSTLTTAVFADSDGELIEVRLDCDQFNDLHSLDIHKPSFQPLIEYPCRQTLRSRFAMSA